ncbi:xanthine dehydrogenase family protein molybdopterin-binding subunit [Ekhidna sp.]
MAEKKKLSRRKFIVRTLLGGTGVLLGATYLGRNTLRRGFYDLMDDPSMLTYMGDTENPVIWFQISNDNVVTLHSPKVEMGQGTFTGMAQMAADELEIDVDNIQVVHAATSTGNIDQMSTGGSTSIAGFWQPLRELSATMREMIKIEGAKKLELDVSQVKATNGTVSGGGKTLTYGEVVDGVTEWEIPDVPALKDPNDYKYVGKPVPRVDLVDKVVGAPIFGMDGEFPNMLFGAVARPSKIGAKFISADTSKAQGMPGVVKIVEEVDFVGVVAKSMIEAENAKNAISVKWNTDKSWETEDIENLIQVGNGNDMIIQKEGSSGWESDAKEVDQFYSAEYSSPIGAHAQIEPNGAVAIVENDTATLMISTQVVKITRSEVAKRLGLDEEQVNIVPTFLGGGFGRRLHTPHAVQVAVMSKAVNAPVKCFFNRKEEFQNDTFRPPTHHVMKAQVNDEGVITALQHDFASGDVAIDSALVPGFAHTIVGTDIGAIRGGQIQYRNIENVRAISWHVELPFATSWWRSLGLLANTFAIESFMDELAIKKDKDPIQMRLDYIQNDEAGKRLRKVIEVAREKGGYANTANGNRAMGFAASTDAGTPCAHVVEVLVENNEIKVEKVTCVIDPGFAVNPDQVKAQCEGSIIMGMSASLYEKMYVEKSELRPTIYGPYKMALMRHAPKEINVEIINGTGTPGAVGEPPLGPIAAAIANAVFRITGKRLRQMPLSLA